VRFKPIGLGNNAASAIEANRVENRQRIYTRYIGYTVIKKNTANDTVAYKHDAVGLPLRSQPIVPNNLFSTGMYDTLLVRILSAGRSIMIIHRGHHNRNRKR